MAAPPIYNPPIPYLAAIPGGVPPGRMIRIQGNVPHGAQRFAINLQCGPNTDPRDDIALHLNFRFVERCVVRNNLTGMQWGPEETNGGIPLTPGTGFEALILCEHQSYKIALNGMHFCEFIHRVPYQRVSYLTIDGDVHVNTISFEGDTVASPGFAPGPPVSGYGQPAYAPPSYGGPPPPYSSQPVYSAQSAPMMSSMPMTGGSYQGQQRSGGIGTGTAIGLGVGGMAAAGLAGYALGGGFSSDSPEEHSAPYGDVELIGEENVERPGDAEVFEEQNGEPPADAEVFEEQNDEPPADVEVFEEQNDEPPADAEVFEEQNDEPIHQAGDFGGDDWMD